MLSRKGDSNGMKENNPLTLLRVMCGPEGQEEYLDIDPQEYRIYLRHYYEEDGKLVLWLRPIEGKGKPLKDRWEDKEDETDEN